MLISVIVPVYNAGEYLEKCVNSILNQTFTDFELILVDDGSTDASGSMCDEFAQKDSRVKVIHQSNAGSSAARNVGIKASSGAFLSFVDSDDWLDPDFLEVLSTPVLKSLKAGEEINYIVQTGRDETDGNGNNLPDICIPPEKETMIPGKEFFKTLLLHEGDCSMCTKLVKKEFFKAREFPVGRLNEDFKVLIYMLLDCEGVLSLPGHKYHVYYKPESNTRKQDKNQFSRVFKDCVDNADEAEQMVRCIYPDMKSIAIRFGLFQRLQYLLHIPISMMRPDYEGYSDCVAYIRRFWLRGLFSRYLTGKNKLYLTLLAAAPKTVRKAHARAKGFD